jgi:hypothetical protein
MPADPPIRVRVGLQRASSSRFNDELRGKARDVFWSAQLGSRIE